MKEICNLYDIQPATWFELLALLQRRLRADMKRARSVNPRKRLRMSPNIKIPDTMVFQLAAMWALIKDNPDARAVTMINGRHSGKVLWRYRHGTKTLALAWSMTLDAAGNLYLDSRHAYIPAYKATHSKACQACHPLPGPYCSDPDSYQAACYSAGYAGQTGYMLLRRKTWSVVLPAIWLLGRSTSTSYSARQPGASTSLDAAAV